MSPTLRIALAVAVTPLSASAAPADGLAPPAGAVLAFKAAARGLQVYECRKTDEQPAWTLVGPIADLFDASGKRIGRHYAGPTWEAADGSKVVGKVAAKADAPDGHSVPWLLLTAASRDGGGRMAEISAIQRLDTDGGAAPAGGCDAANVGLQTRVAYSANYLFYRPGPGK